MNLDTMRQDLGETENESYIRAKRSTAKLLSLLVRHHWQDEPEVKKPEPIEVCIPPIEGPVTVDKIKRMVCLYYGITHEDIISEERTKGICRPRMIANYLCREFTTRSSPYIAKQFHQDHTTSLHAAHRVKEWIATDPKIAADVKILSEMLAS